MHLVQNLVILSVLGLVPVVASAQAVPAASAAIKLDLFAGANGTYTGLSSGRNAGITGGVDIGFHPVHGLTPAFEARGTFPFDQGAVDGQKNVLGGIQVSTRVGRLHPYVDFLFGRGEIMYLGNGYQVPGTVIFYTASHANVFAVGGGLDYRLRSQWALKLDFQSERYATPVTTSGYVHPNALTVGLTYQVVFRGRSRRQH